MIFLLVKAVVFLALWTFVERSLFHPTCPEIVPRRAVVQQYIVDPVQYRKLGSKMQDVNKWMTSSDPQSQKRKARQGMARVKRLWIMAPGSPFRVACPP